MASLHPVPLPPNVPGRLASDRFNWILDYHRRSTGRYSIPLADQPSAYAGEAHLIQSCVAPWDSRERVEVFVLKDLVTNIGNHRHFGNGVLVIEETVCLGGPEGVSHPVPTPATNEMPPPLAPQRNDPVSIPVVSSVIAPRPPTPRPALLAPNSYTYSPIPIQPPPETTLTTTLPARAAHNTSLITQLLNRRILEHESSHMRERELALELELIYARREEEEKRRRRTRQSRQGMMNPNPSPLHTDNPTNMQTEPTTEQATTEQTAAEATPDEQPAEEDPMDTTPHYTTPIPEDPRESQPPVSFGVAGLLQEKEKEPVNQNVPPEANVQGENEIPDLQWPGDELTPEPPASATPEPPTPEQDESVDERPQERLPPSIPRYPFRARRPARGQRAHIVLGDSANGGRILGRETRRVVTFRTEAPSLALRIGERGELDKLLNVRPSLWMPKEKAFVRAITRQLRRATAAEVGYGEPATAQPGRLSEEMEEDED